MTCRPATPDAPIHAASESVPSSPASRPLALRRAAPRRHVGYHIAPILLLGLLGAVTPGHIGTARAFAVGFSHDDPFFYPASGAVEGAAVAFTVGTSYNAVGTTASVDWGDGYVGTPSVAADPIYLANIRSGDHDSYWDGTFSWLSASHTYDRAGRFVVTVSYNGNSDTHVITVADAPIAALSAASTTLLGAQPSYSGTVATFSDAEGYTARNYAALIDWGDGSTSLGTIAPDPHDANGVVVSGSHSFRRITALAYSATVTLKDTGGLVATASPQFLSNGVNDTAEGSITYSGRGWIYSASRGLGDYGDDVHATQVDGDSATFPFVGTGVSFVTELNADEGNVDVYLDDVFRQTVNCWAGTRAARQMAWSIDGLPAGSHKLKLVKRSGTWMLLDALASR